MWAGPSSPMLRRAQSISQSFPYFRQSYFLEFSRSPICWRGSRAQSANVMLCSKCRMLTQQHMALPAVHNTWKTFFSTWCRGCCSSQPNFSHAGLHFKQCCLLAMWLQTYDGNTGTTSAFRPQQHWLMETGFTACPLTLLLRFSEYTYFPNNHVCLLAELRTSLYIYSTVMSTYNVRLSFTQRDTTWHSSVTNTIATNLEVELDEDL